MCLIISFFLHYYYIVLFEIYFVYVILPLHLYHISAFLYSNSPKRFLLYYDFVSFLLSRLQGLKECRKFAA